MIEVATNGSASRADRSLGSLVEELVSFIERRRAERPFVIEVAGTPRAGKTTTLTALADALRGHDLRIATVDERASGCPIPDKQDPSFNYWTFFSTLLQIIEAQRGDTDVVVIDRGIVDAACWMDWHRDGGGLTEEEHRAIEDFMLLPRWTRALNLVLVMTAEPVVAVKREPDRGSPGQIVNHETLSAFNAAVGRVRARFDRHYPLVGLDTTRLDQDLVLSNLIAAVLLEWSSVKQA